MKSHLSIYFVLFSGLALVVLGFQNCSQDNLTKSHPSQTDNSQSQTGDSLNQPPFGSDLSTLPTDRPLTSEEFQATQVDCATEAAHEVNNPELSCFQIVFNPTPEDEVPGVPVSDEEFTIQDAVELGKTLFSDMEQGPEMILSFPNGLNQPLSADMTGANFNLYVVFGSGSSLSLTSKLSPQSDEVHYFPGDL